MSDDWQLLRCECGHSFGLKSGGTGRCTRCGSSSFKKVSDYADSVDLAEAVSNANLPKELAGDISSRLRSKASKSLHRTSNSGNSRPIIIRAMHNATDDDGILSIASLKKELSNLGIEDPTPDFLIGQAEIEGILFRDGPNSWTWL